MKLLRSFTKKYLHLAFAATGSTTVEIYERPGYWMASDELAKLILDLKIIATKTLQDGTLNYGVLGGDPDCLKTCIITLARDKKSGKPLAFNVLSCIPLQLHGEPIDLLHLGLVMIDPHQRSKGLSWVLYGLTCFLFYLRGGLRPIWISNVTQVPAVYGMVSTSFDRVFPGGKGVVVNFEHLSLARQILSKHPHVFGVSKEAHFNEEHFVIENAYTGGSDELKKTYEACAKHRDEHYNIMCQTMLDYDRGDDFIQIGQLSLNAAKNFAFREIPRKSIRGLLTAFTFLMAQSLILPFLHWFGATKHYKNLRPRETK